MKSLTAFVIGFSVLLSAVVQAEYQASEFNNPEFEATGLIMIDKRGSLIRFFNPNTFEQISNLTIDGTPHELVLSPDRTIAYVPNYGDGVYGNNPHPGQSIAVIDLKTRQLANTIDISPYQAPHGVAVDKNGTLYVSCDISRQLLVIDPLTLKITAAIDTVGTGHWVSVLPDGSKAYTANKKDKLFVSVVDIEKQMVVAEVPMPNGTQGIAMSPDGKFVLALDMAEPKIIKIDTTTDKIVEEITIANNEGGAWDAKYSPNGQHIMVVNARERKANLYSGTLQTGFNSVPTGSQPFGIEFTPDSNTALISNHGDGTITVVDVASGKVIRTFTAGKGIETLAFF